MLCTKCECSFYLARSILSYSNSLLTGCLIGLVIGSAVVNYQMSLLEWERNLILDEIDLNKRMEHDCKVDLSTFGENSEKSELVQQGYRDRDNLKLDIDIIKQLKVNLEAKIKRYQAIKIG